MDPDGPALDFPVEREIDPLTPLVPAFAVNRDAFPLDEAVPAPDTIDTKPPVLVVLDPAPIETDPPGCPVPAPEAT